jgi:carotenoid 1,2-hydratase
MNVVTYGRGGRWTMTDRGARRAAAHPADRMQIGRRRWQWDGDKLIVIEIDEMSTPHAQKVRWRR